MQNKKTLIENCCIITADKDDRVIDNGYILFDYDNIIEIGGGSIDKTKIGNDVEIINAKNAVVSPGFINTHQHLPMSILRSGKECTANRLFSYFFPFEKEILNGDIVYNASRLSAWEMLTTGTTTVVDMYYFEDRVIDGASEVGMRIVAGETIMTDKTPSQESYKTALEFMSSVVEKYKNNKLVHPILAPHSPYMCSTKALEEIYSFANKNNMRITMHCSEFENEIELIEKNIGRKIKTPVQYLNELGILSNKWHIAHGIFLNDEDIKILADKHVSLAHCPIANIKAGKGIARVCDMLESGVNVSLGTDGPLSGNRLDLSYAISTAYCLQKLFRHNATVLTPKEMIKIATINGAKSVGLENKIGSIEVGKYADLVLWHNDTPSMCVAQDELANLVVASTGKDVNKVWVGGKLSVENGKLITTDTADIINKCKVIKEEIKDKIINFVVK